MLFKNLCTFRLVGELVAAEQLEASLVAAAFQPCGAHDYARVGFVPPFAGGPFVRVVDGRALFAIREDVKRVPPRVLRMEVDARVAKIEAEQGRTVYRKERNEIKAEATTALLPRAFPVTTVTLAYLDPAGGLLAIDASSWSRAETVATALRKALGSLPVERLTTSSDPRAVITRWLADGPPADIVLGDCATLADLRDASCTVSAKGHDLRGDEILEHLQCGKQATRVALCWDDRLECRLDADLRVLRLRYTDALEESIDDMERDPDGEARFDSDFHLGAVEVARFVPRLLELCA